jgi:hypothetical protein
MAKSKAKKPKRAFMKAQFVDNARDKWKAFSTIGLAVLTALGGAGTLWAAMEKNVDPFWYGLGVFVIGFAGLVGAYIKQPTVSEPR